MIDVVIIGAGPAGISASLYAVRAGKKVLVLYHGESNLEKASKIDNYYGFENGISGQELYENGMKQAKNLGVEVRDEEVLHLEKEGEIFKIKTEIAEYEAKSVILATGNKKLRPNIKGVLEFEGKGISYCAVCDGFFYRKKEVVVIGNGKFAISEAEVLKNIASHVTILTNGEKMLNQEEFEVNEKKIKEIHGNNKVETVEFEDGSKLDIQGIFIALRRSWRK